MTSTTSNCHVGGSGGTGGSAQAGAGTAVEDGCGDSAEEPSSSPSFLTPPCVSPLVQHQQTSSVPGATRGVVCAPQQPQQHSATGSRTANGISSEPLPLEGESATLEHTPSDNGMDLANTTFSASMTPVDSVGGLTPLANAPVQPLASIGGGGGDGGGGSHQRSVRPRWQTDVPSPPPACPSSIANSSEDGEGDGDRSGSEGGGGSGPQMPPAPLWVSGAGGSRSGGGAPLAWASGFKGESSSSSAAQVTQTAAAPSWATGAQSTGWASGAPSALKAPSTSSPKLAGSSMSTTTAPPPPWAMPSRSPAPTAATAGSCRGPTPGASGAPLAPCGTAPVSTSLQPGPTAQRNTVFDFFAPRSESVASAAAALGATATASSGSFVGGMFNQGSSGTPPTFSAVSTSSPSVPPFVAGHSAPFQPPQQQQQQQHGGNGSLGVPFFVPPSAAGRAPSLLGGPTAPVRQPSTSTCTAGATAPVYQRRRRGSGGEEDDDLSSTSSGGGGGGGGQPLEEEQRQMQMHKQHTFDIPPTKVLNFLYVGNVQNAQNIEFLREHNIQDIINVGSCEYSLADESDDVDVVAESGGSKRTTTASSVSIHHFKVKDESDFPIVNVFEEIFAELDRCRRRYWRAFSSSSGGRSAGGESPGPQHRVKQPNGGGAEEEEQEGVISRFGGGSIGTTPEVEEEGGEGAPPNVGLRRQQSGKGALAKEQEQEGTKPLPAVQAALCSSSGSEGEGKQHPSDDQQPSATTPTAANEKRSKSKQRSSKGGRGGGGEDEQNEECNPPKVLLHCEKGVSRSATVAIAYLVRRNGWTVVEAFLYLQSRRHIIEPNPGFMEALRQYEKTLTATPELELAQQRRRKALVCTVRNIRKGASEKEVQGYYEDHVGSVWTVNCNANRLWMICYAMPELVKETARQNRRLVEQREEHPLCDPETQQPLRISALAGSSSAAGGATGSVTREGSMRRPSAAASREPKPNSETQQRPSDRSSGRASAAATRASTTEDQGKKGDEQCPPQQEGVSAAEAYES